VELTGLQKKRGATQGGDPINQALPKGIGVANSRWLGRTRIEEKDVVRFLSSQGRGIDEAFSLGGETRNSPLHDR